MILSIPFLATKLDQFDPSSVAKGFGVEASLFDRADIIDDTRWHTVQRNVEEVSSRHEPPSFTFHFPVNDCNYVEDGAVRNRLYESLELVDRYDLNGLVLHSNQVYSVHEWMQLDLPRVREKFSEFVGDLRRRVEGANFWIGLENMPIMGNQGVDLDPLLVFPDDFAGLLGGNVGVTWDFCHYSYSVHVVDLLETGKLRERQFYPSIKSAGFDSFESLAPHIFHFHFSAFNGVASVISGVQCREGQLPWEATLPSEIYADAFKLMAQVAPRSAVTLEIAETDYCQRENAYLVADWCKQVVAEVNHE